MDETRIVKPRFFFFDVSTNQYIHLFDGINFGRKNSDIKFNKDPKVSQFHFQVEIIGDQVSVEDMGSSNGTYVNGVQLGNGQKRALKKNDVVQFGVQKLVFTQHIIVEDINLGIKTVKEDRKSKWSIRWQYAGEDSFALLKEWQRSFKNGVENLIATYKREYQSFKKISNWAFIEKLLFLLFLGGLLSVFNMQKIYLYEALSLGSFALIAKLNGYLSLVFILILYLFFFVVWVYKHRSLVGMMLHFLFLGPSSFYLVKLTSHFIESNDQYTLWRSYYDKGLKVYLRGEFEQAEKYFQFAYNESISTSKNSYQHAMSSFYLTKAYYQNRVYERGLNQALETEKLFKRNLKWSKEYFAGLLMLKVQLALKGEEEDAVYLFTRKALEKFNKNEIPFRREDLAFLYGLMGDIYLKEKGYKKTIDFYRKAQEIYAQLSKQNFRAHGNLTCKIGNVHRILVNYKKALIYLNKCEKWSRKFYSSSHPQLALVSYYFGMYHWKNFQFETAYNRFEKSYQLFKERILKVDSQMNVYSGHYEEFIREYLIFLKVVRDERLRLIVSQESKNLIKLAQEIKL